MPAGTPWEYLGNSFSDFLRAQRAQLENAPKTDAYYYDRVQNQGVDPRFGDVRGGASRGFPGQAPQTPMSGQGGPMPPFGDVQGGGSSTGMPQQLGGGGSPMPDLRQLQQRIPPVTTRNLLGPGPQQATSPSIAPTLPSRPFSGYNMGGGAPMSPGQPTGGGGMPWGEIGQGAGVLLGAALGGGDFLQGYNKQQEQIRLEDVERKQRETEWANRQAEEQRQRQFQEEESERRRSGELQDLQTRINSQVEQARLDREAEGLRRQQEMDRWRETFGATQKQNSAENAFRAQGLDLQKQGLALRDDKDDPAMIAFRALSQNPLFQMQAQQDPSFAAKAWQGLQQSFGGQGAGLPPPPSLTKEQLHGLPDGAQFPMGGKKYVKLGKGRYQLVE